MNILHTEASSGWGGQEIRILREARGMRDRGHLVFFAVSKGAKLADHAREAGFKVYELSFKKRSWFFTFFKLLSIFTSCQIDLINTHSSLDAWIGGISARFNKIGVLRTRHLSSPIKKGINSRLLYHILADFVVTTCEKIVPIICEQSGKSKNLFLSIPTGVEVEKIEVSKEERALFRNSIGVKEEEFLIGTACFMRSWKGIDVFLQAADLLRGEKDIKWVIIGGGHEEGYRKKAKEMNLHSVLSFTGHLKNPFPAIGSLDVFALLSTAHEGVSQAILQAAYLQKPLIATTTGGLSEVCLDQITGFTVPLFSPEKVVEAVLKLKKDRLYGKQMGQRARALIEERFTFSHTLDEMEKVYKHFKPRR